MPEKQPGPQPTVAAPEPKKRTPEPAAADPLRRSLRSMDYGQGAQALSPRPATPPALPSGAVVPDGSAGTPLPTLDPALLAGTSGPTAPAGPDPLAGIREALVAGPRPRQDYLQLPGGMRLGALDGPRPGFGLTIPIPQRTPTPEEERSRRLLEEFRSRTHSVTDFQPSSSLGMFDLVYDPRTGAIDVSVKVKFRFVGGGDSMRYGKDPGAVDWADQQEKDRFKAKLMGDIRSFWSGRFQFGCVRPGWESLKGKVGVSVREVEEGEHFVAELQKMPAGRDPTSSVVEPDRREDGTHTSGTALLDSADVAKRHTTHRMYQEAAVHEFGHMLGLDDEYVGGNIFHGDTPWHQATVERLMPGEADRVRKQNDDRVMACGERVLKHHYVTILEGLVAATSVEEWKIV